MFKNKFKAYKFSIAACILGSLLTGLNYVLTNMPLLRITFIITSIASLVVIVCYVIEKSWKRLKKV
ncbi:MAG TPA: hypothetical protein VHT96_03850 [Clostridia bacterium]|nr:hypothetical protein [Clostridia bacterium]